MRKAFLGALLVFVVGPLAAQEQVGPGRDVLRQQVLERFTQNFIREAGLTEDQRAEFRQTQQRHFRERGRFAQRRRGLLRAIEEQMRPGVAANEDSVTRLVESIVALGEEMAAAVRGEQEEYAGFLGPVQRALLLIHYERFQRQIEGVQRRGMQRRGNRPGGPLNQGNILPD